MSSQEQKSTLRSWFIESALEALKTREAGCWYHVLEDPENRYPDDTWALVIGWLPDGEALDGYSAYAGIKTQPVSSVMRCDFDVDWQSPLCADGSVDDTETCIEGMSETELESAFNWLLNIAQSYGLSE